MGKTDYGQCPNTETIGISETIINVMNKIFIII